MTARPQCRAPTTAGHVEAAAEQLVNAAELEREVMEAAFLADVEQEQIVVVIRCAAAQEVAPAGVGIAGDEAQAFRIEGHDLVGLVDHEHGVSHLERASRREKLPAGVDAIWPARRIERKLRRRDGLALRDAESD